MYIVKPLILISIVVILFSLSILFQRRVFTGDYQESLPEEIIDIQKVEVSTKPGKKPVLPESILVKYSLGIIPLPFQRMVGMTCLFTIPDSIKE